MLDGINPIAPQWQTPTAVAFGGMLFLMVLDVIVGTMVAFSQRSLSSKINREGITRKLVSILMVVAVAVAKAMMIQLYPALEQLPIIMGAAIAFSCSEVISLMESGTKVGVVSPHLEGLAHLMQQRIGDLDKPQAIPVKLEATGTIVAPPVAVEEPSESGDG